MTKKIIFIIAFFTLAACGAGSEDQNEQIATLCMNQLNTEQDICDCIGEESMTVLQTDDERALVIAMLAENADAALEIRQSLPMDGAMRAGMFLATTPAQCVQKLRPAQ